MSHPEFAGTQGKQLETGNEATTRIPAYSVLSRASWFTTHTFLVDVGPDPALARFDRWLARLAEAIRQKSRCSPELQSACAVEWTLRNRVHLHAVVSGRGLGDHRRMRWQHRWEGIDRACGMARVFPAKGRASAYLAKYCGKGGIVVVRGRFAGWPASHDA